MLTENTKQYLLQGFYDGLHEPFNGEIYDWAAKYVNLKAPFSITGPFDVSISPYLKLPLEYIKNDKIKEINILKAVQTGGSLVLQLYLMWLIVNRPGSTLLLHQPGDMSKVIMETKLIPLIKSTSIVNDLIPNKRNAIKKDLISLPHMDVIVSAAKETMLQSLSIQYLLMDEVWQYRKGDIEQAKARTRAHIHHSKIVCAAQAGDNADDWHKQYNSAGRIFDWGWLCPACNTKQPHKWGIKREDNTYGGMTWDANETTCPDGKWHYENAGKTARLECVKVDCKHKLYDTSENRDYLNRTGEYIETVNPSGKSGVVSFHWTSWAMRNQTFASIVERYLAAKEEARYGNVTKLQDFYQKDLAEFYTFSGPVDNIKIQVEEYNPFDKYGDYTFLTVDCQQDLVQLFYVIRSWCKNGDSRQVKRGVVSSFVELEEIRKQYNIPSHRVGIDSGYQATQIYKECLKHGSLQSVGGKKIYLSWSALKGSDKWDFLHKDGVKRLYSERNNGDPVDNNFKGLYAPLYLWSNKSYKDMLEILMKGKTCKWVTSDTDDEYEKHMNSEILLPSINNKTKKEQLIWTCKPGIPNHYRDCELQNLVMAQMCGCIGNS